MTTHACDMAPNACGVDAERERPLGCVRRRTKTASSWCLTEVVWCGCTEPGNPRSEMVGGTVGLTGGVHSLVGGREKDSLMDFFDLVKS